MQKQFCCLFSPLVTRTRHYAKVEKNYAKKNDFCFLLLFRFKIGKFEISVRSTDIRASSVVSSLDEGGFNEPSPEIKAPLKPQYTFEINSPPLPPSPPARSTSTLTQHFLLQHEQQIIEKTSSLPRVPPPPIPIVAEEDEEDLLNEERVVNNDDDEVDEKFDLNYASLTHAVSAVQKVRSEESATERILYATIKPELPPPTELIEAEVRGEAKLLDEIREVSFIPMVKDEEEALPRGPSLDFKDVVAYADASESDEVAPEAMTADEAETLLSSRYVQVIWVFFSF